MAFYRCGGGTDTSVVTAGAADVLQGKVIVNADGEPISGTIPSKAAQTYTPTTANQTISAKQYLSGVQTIKGDANLKAENIISGKSIFGVNGNVVIPDEIKVHSYIPYGADIRRIRIYNNKLYILLRRNDSLFHLYRYDNGINWTYVCQIPVSRYICDFLIINDYLYLLTAPNSSQEADYIWKFSMSNINTVVNTVAVPSANYIPRLVLINNEIWVVSFNKISKVPLDLSALTEVITGQENMITMAYDDTVIIKYNDTNIIMAAGKTIKLFNISTLQYTTLSTPPTSVSSLSIHNGVIHLVGSGAIVNNNGNAGQTLSTFTASSHYVLKNNVWTQISILPYVAVIPVRAISFGDSIYAIVPFTADNKRFMVKIKTN